MNILKHGIYFCSIVLFLILQTEQTNAQTRHYLSLENYNKVSHDERIVRDITTYVSHSFPRVDEKFWAVIEVNPAPKSLDKKVFFQDPDGKWHKVIEGTVKVVKTLPEQSKIPTEGYKWEIPAQRFGNGFVGGATTPDSSYFIFDNNYINSSAICRINGNQKDIYKFYPIFLIPAGWTEFAFPEKRYYQDHKELFKDYKVTQNLGALSKLLKNKNPLLATTAARLLASTDNFSPIAESLLEATGWERTMFTFLLMRYSAVKKNFNYLKEVETNIETAKDEDSLWDTTLGIYAARNLLLTHPNESGEYLKSLDQLLQAIDRKQVALNTDAVADGYVDTVLRITGIRPLSLSTNLPKK